MFRLFISILVLSMFYLSSTAQVTVKQTATEVSVSQAVLLGVSEEVRNLVPSGSDFKAKKKYFKRNKKAPDNFKGRRGQSKAIIPELEHLGPDPLRQVGHSRSGGGMRDVVEPLVNIEGIGGIGSPHDPSGDVGLNYYVQAINVTEVGIFDKSGNLVQQFQMGDLWAPLGASSAGDPIVIFDEQSNRWFITEFTDPANLLVAVSVTDDPLGAYYAYSFSTPNFPDYPKYAVWSDALVVTTNEVGAGALHQYFLNKSELLAGSPTVTMQRVEIPGNMNTEAGFFVSTPVDTDGNALPTDDRPVVMKLNDASWGEVSQDAVELIRFDIDWANPNNTVTETVSIPVSNYDGYPCSVGSFFGFDCVPQLGGGGLDAIPEVIMNVPKYRNFGTHESIVLSFITDVTNGQNLSGIRWMELRKTGSDDWSLYQEGTYSPDDLDRFMPSIAIDKNGNIGLGYNVSSDNEYVGVRYTGRYADDPLGIMTVAEYNVANGSNAINSDGRFGDYAQMSVDPNNGTSFWYTTEYATGGSSSTRIVSFELQRDEYDLSLVNLTQPQTSTSLGQSESVEIEIKNVGMQSISNFEVGFSLDGNSIDQQTISSSLPAGQTMTYTFPTTANLSAFGDYTIGTYVSHPDDTNHSNDTLNNIVSHLYALNASLELSADTDSTCETEATITARIRNEGADVLSSGDIVVALNGNEVETINWTGALASGSTHEISITVGPLAGGTNDISMSFNNPNGGTDGNPSNNTANVNVTLNANSVNYTLNLTTDEYPTETTWELTGPNGDVIASGGPYNEMNTLKEATFCLIQGVCYTLTINDSYGDGIYGDGDAYSVLDENGVVVLSGMGDFTYSTSQNFCTEEQPCTLTAEFTVVGDSDNGNGSILVVASSGTAPYTYSIDSGASFQTESLFENLTGGDYDVVVKDAVDCIYMDTVSVPSVTALSGIGNGGYEFNITPNPNDGFFYLEVNVEGYDEPSLRFDVINAAGMVVQSRRMGSYNGVFVTPVSLMKYPSGTYFVKVYGGEFHATKKVVYSSQ